MLEALASAIDGTNGEEAARLAAEFNASFGHLVRASVEAESVQGPEERIEPDGVSRAPTSTNIQTQKTPVTYKTREKTTEPALESITKERNKRKEKEEEKAAREEIDTPPSSSDESEARKPKKKKKKRNASKKRQANDSDSSSSSEPSTDSSSSCDDSSDNSSRGEEAELCYEITEFESADLPDLPDRWDKGFKKLRSYVPLTLFNTALLESFYDDEGEIKSGNKSAKSKSSLKSLEKQLTYGDFIEMSDLEERYAREIYGLDTYADYVSKHKKIVSDLKKTYNCWMIGLRYHLKVRTVIFRRRKLIKSKVKGKTVLKDKVKIPNGLQPLVERQARHDADRAGDLQYVDNPYAPGGPKHGFNFSTGRAPVVNQGVLTSGKSVETPGLHQASQRGRRAGAIQKPYVRRPGFAYPRFNWFGNQGNCQPGKRV